MLLLDMCLKQQEKPYSFTCKPKSMQPACSAHIIHHTARTDSEWRKKSPAETCWGLPFFKILSFLVFFVLLKIISNYLYAGKVEWGSGAMHMCAVPKEARKRVRSPECEPPSMWVLGTWILTLCENFPVPCSHLSDPEWPFRGGHAGCFARQLSSSVPWVGTGATGTSHLLDAPISRCVLPTPVT